MAFEDILKSIAEETDRTQLAAMAAKYPSLRKYAEEGESWEKLSPRLEKMDTAARTPEGLLKRAEDWRDHVSQHWDTSTKKWKETIAVEAALAEARNRIAELEERTDADMTPEEIKQVVKTALDEAGVVSNAALEARITKALREEVPRTFEPVVARFENVYAKLTPLAGEHKEKYGEPIDYDKILGHMRDEYGRNGGIPVTPEAAYNAVYHEKIEAKSKAQIEADKKAEYDRGKAEGVKEAAQSRGGPGMPADGGAPVGIGPLKAKVLARAKAAEEKDGVNDRLGSGVTAMRAGMAYRQKAAQGTQ